MTIDFERLKKPPRGAYVLKRKKDRGDLRTKERNEKDVVRGLDKKCRWPHCLHRGVALEVAHLRHKSMGGNPTGDRSERHLMILLCLLHHRGDPQAEHPEGSLDKGQLRIEPLTDAGTRGPCVFYRERVTVGPTSLDQDWIEIGRERIPGVLVKRFSRGNGGGLLQRERPQNGCMAAGTDQGGAYC